MGKYKIALQPALNRVKLKAPPARADNFRVLMLEHQDEVPFKSVDYFIKALNITDYTVLSQERENLYLNFFNNYKNGKHETER